MGDEKGTSLRTFGLKKNGFRSALWDLYSEIGRNGKAHRRPVLL